MATKIEIRRELEWRRMENDLVYFLEKRWKVNHVGRGYKLFDLFPYQRQEADHFQVVHRYANLRLTEGAKHLDRQRMRQNRLKARQLGWTTLIGGCVFWSAFFHEHHPWLITQQSEGDAQDTLSKKIKQPFSMLPQWMRERGPKIKSETMEKVEFDNGSEITAIPSTSSSGRGKAVFGSVMDEAAFMENAADLFAAIDPMTYGPLYMFSTANGMGNAFHDTWIESLLGDSEWEGGFWPWSARPDRDDEWYDLTKRKFRGKEHLLYQEHPSTPEEAFLRSGRTALPMDLLREEQDWLDPFEKYDLLSLKKLMDSNLHQEMTIDEQWEQSLITDDEPRDMELHVWERPEIQRYDDGRLMREPNYAIGVDVSEGLDHGDFSALAVLDANSWEVVATVRAHIPVADLADYVEAIGYWYHTALIGVERNNHGLLPLYVLQEHAYPRLFRMDTVAQIKSGDRTPRYGFITSRSSKPKMVQEFNGIIKDAGIALHDKRFLHESSTFLSDGKGGYGASPGNHDDLIMATLITAQLGLDVGVYPTVFHDPKPGPPTIGEVFDIMQSQTEADRAYGTALAGGIGQPDRLPDDVKKSFEMLITDR